MGTGIRFSKKAKLIGYIIIIAILSIAFFIGISYIYHKNTSADIAEAVNFSESISLMAEKSSANILLQHKKRLIEEEKARIAEMERQREEELLLEESKKKAYLTFDDGPSEKVTHQILDILNAYDIKATFFVVGNAAERLPEIVKRIHREGHAIGNHSYSHRYDHIYRKTSNFIEELEETERVLKDILGEDYETNIIRFPGGSFGERRKPFRKAVLEEGYVYYDWNSLNGDAESYDILSNDRLIQRFKSTFKGQDELIVLMHDLDAKYTTPESLPYIIEYLQQNDYVFRILDD